MSSEAACPNCGTVSPIPAEFAGRRVKCKKCGHKFRTPGPAPEGVVPPLPSAGVPDAPTGFALATPPSMEPVPPRSPAAAPAVRPTPGPRRKVVITRPRRAARGPGGRLWFVVGTLAAVFAIGATVSATAAYLWLARDTVRVAKTPDAAPDPLPPDGPAPEPKPVSPPRADRKDADEPRPPVATPPAPKTAVPRRTAPPFTLPAPPTAPGAIVAPARSKLALDLPAGQVKAVRFAGADPRVVAVLWSVFGGFQGQGATDAVDVYSLATGRRVTRVEFPADGLIGGRRAFDLSPDGGRVAVEQPAGKLTVFDVDGGAKVLDGVDPFAAAPAPRTGPPARFRFAGSADRIAVVDRSAAVDVWDVKAMARVAAGRPLGPADGPAPAVSDRAGAGFWVFVRGAADEVATATAAPGATVPVADPAAVPLALGLDAAGRRAAVAYRTPGPAGGHELAVLDLRPDKLGVTDKVPLPDAAGTPAGASLVGGGTIAVVQTDDRAGCLVYDTEHKVPVAYLRAAAGPPVKHFADPEADRLCWVMPDPADGKKSLLVAVDANFDGYQALVAAAETAKRPAYLVPRIDGLAR